MKSIRIAALAALVALCLAGCQGAPSDAKIKEALDAGTITVEDAKEKGWIDDAWIKKNFTSIKAATKIHVFDKFETTYLDGTPVSSDVISGKMCLVFFDTTKEETMQKLKVFEQVDEELREMGIPVMGILMDVDPEAAKEKLAHCTFPVIVYNQDMQRALEKYESVLDADVVSVFTKEGGFYSAWHTEAQAEELVSFAKLLSDET
ncbi:MAG: hypothetical protein RSJ41_00425 [Clostridia bacterium]